MKKGQIYEGIAEELEFPNKGIVWMEDKKVVVKGAILGQKIQFSIKKVRKDKCEGRLLQVLTPSHLETETPACNHFPDCGGCTYQALTYETQLQIKRNQVKHILEEVCSDFIFEGILGSPNPWEYRNKMEFTFGDEVKDGPLALGMHKKGSFHDIITASGCKIVDSDYSAVLDCVLQFFTEIGTKYYHKLSHLGYLRHLVIRKAVKTGEILISLVTSTQEIHNLQPLVNKIKKLSLKGRLMGMLHIENDGVADVVKSDRTQILYGQDYFYEELLGLKFKISTFSFFQTNTLGAEVLYEKVREYVGQTKNKVIFDLYSGTGTIAQVLAPVAKKVIGVEIVEEAVEAARENAKGNGLLNCEFITGDVLKVIDDLGEKPDLIVLDPPRDGIHPKALPKIVGFGVERIVYISCKPTSLARDLVMFLEAGYHVEKVCLVDLFPAGVHVESIILMTRCGSEKKSKI